MRVDDLMDMTDLEKMEAQRKHSKLNKVLQNANSMLITHNRKNSITNASVTKTSTFDDDLELE